MYAINTLVASVYPKSKSEGNCAVHYIGCPSLYMPVTEKRHLLPILIHTHTFSQDVLVVTAPGSGAEIIPFLKTWVNLPAAVGFAILYAKVCTSQ